MDPAAQDETYHQVAKILNKDVPQLYLWQLAGVHAVNKRVQDLKVPSFERYVTIDAAQLVGHLVGTPPRTRGARARARTGPSHRQAADDRWAPTSFDAS